MKGSPYQRLGDRARGDDPVSARSPGLNMDTLGRRHHFARHRVLTVILALVGIHGVSQFVQFEPSCPNSEAIGVCGSGKDGQVNPADTVSFTSCYSSVLAKEELLGLAQVGLTTNSPPIDSCLLYGCGINECLKETQPCHSSGKATFQCVPSENIVDMQPAPLTMSVALVLAALFMLITRKPYELSNTRVAGMLVLTFGAYQMAQTIRIYRSCPWGEATYSQCQGGPSNMTQVVGMDTCFEQNLLGFSPLASNVPRAPGGCQLYGCASTECLKVTASCHGDQSTQHECVAQKATTDAKPGVVAAEALIMLMGVVLMSMSYRYTMGWRRVFAVALFVYSLHLVGNGVAFQKSCDWATTTTAFCGSGTDGQIRNSEVVGVQSCAVNPLVLFPLTPFASNLFPVDACLQHGCNTDECLQTVSPCHGPGLPGPPTSTTCVPQRAVATNAPLYVGFHALLATASLLVLAVPCLGRGAGAAVCSWKANAQKARPGVLSVSRRRRASHDTRTAAGASSDAMSHDSRA